MILEDINEALIIERFRQEPVKETTIPFGRSSTEDSSMGTLLLREKIQPHSFIVEDGCDSGQHLIALLQNLQKHDIPVQALGTDIAYYNTIVGRILLNTLGLEKSCNFFSAHALHRQGSRSIFGNDGQHIILGYRLLPVFNEQKIFRYWEKLQRETRPGDLWCGSIALPEGGLYERNTQDQEAIKKYSIRAISTKFGGETFVHKPLYGTTTSQLTQYFNKEYKHFNMEFQEEDFSNVILNTFMTKKQFEPLVKQFGFKPATDLVEVDCPDNKRLVALLERV